MMSDQPRRKGQMREKDLLVICEAILEMVKEDAQRSRARFARPNTGLRLEERLRPWIHIPDPKDGDKAQLRKIYSGLRWLYRAHVEGVDPC